MRIKIRLLAYFKEYLPEKSEQGLPTMELGPSATVGDVLLKLGIPPQHPKIIHVNGALAEEKDPLKEGDVLSVFPPLPGG